MFKTVLLPLDPEHPASWEKALPMAEELSAGGDLHILGIVHDIGSAVVAQALPQGFEREVLKHMKDALDRFSEDQTGGRARTHVGHGHVPESILKSAEAVGADLIIMASHKPDDLRTLLVGSNADKVVRHSPIPVLVVR